MLAKRVCKIPTFRHRENKVNYAHAALGDAPRGAAQSDEPIISSL
jgi:hypothetical protein